MEDLWATLRDLAAERVDELDTLAAAYLGDRDELQTITRDELDERLQRGALVLIDVRPEAEYAAGHIPGAISTPPDQLDHALDALPDEGDIAAYCRGPYCAYADDAVRTLQARRHALRLEEGYLSGAATAEPSKPDSETVTMSSDSALPRGEGSVDAVLDSLPPRTMRRGTRLPTIRQPPVAPTGTSTGRWSAVSMRGASEAISVRRRSPEGPSVGQAGGPHRFGVFGKWV